MVQRILDTNRLILHWRRIRPKNASDARRRAHELIALFGSNAIVTPVAIEFVGGTRSAEELRFARAFLSEFRIADQGRILSQDFDRARELAERVPRDGGGRR